MNQNFNEDDYQPLTKKENFFIFSIIGLCSVIWFVLMLSLPLFVIAGYFGLMGLVIIALWFRPFKIPFLTKKTKQ